MKDPEKEPKEDQDQKLHREGLEALSDARESLSEINPEGIENDPLDPGLSENEILWMLNATVAQNEKEAKEQTKK